MKTSVLFVVVALGATASAARAANATSPVDPTQRNPSLAPAGTVTPEKKAPAVNPVWQDKRVEKPAFEKSVAPLGERRSAIDVTEAREKDVREKDSRRPEVLEQKTSAYNHRPAGVSTAGDTTKPPTVAKYQESLTAASASNMARFPAVDRATTAKINRFVFRKNPPDSSALPGEGRVTPAAGGSAVQK